MVSGYPYSLSSKTVRCHESLRSAFFHVLFGVLILPAGEDLEGRQLEMRFLWENSPTRVCMCAQLVGLSEMINSLQIEGLDCLEPMGFAELALYGYVPK